jgi:hypothetical protein
MHLTLKYTKVNTMIYIRNAIFFYRISNAWARVPEVARWCTRPHVQCTATAVRSKINICDCPATRYVLNLL